MPVISVPSQEKIKLDLYDKKIIFYLSQNSRMQLSDLAKKLKISIQRCKYKVERLKREILEPAMFLTYPLLDIKSYIIYAPNLSNETLDSLMKDSRIYFLFQSIGKYQYVLNVVTNSIETFCYEFFSDKHVEVLQIINSYADNFNPFELAIAANRDKQNGKIFLNRKDYKILSYLSMHPDESMLNMQNALSIDRQTIKQRIKQFEESNIVQKFRYGINVFKIGSLAYIIRLKVTPSNKKNILSHIRTNNFSGFVFETYDGYTMHFLPFTHNQVFDFTQNLLDADPTIQIDVIQNTEFYEVNLVPKYVKAEFERRAK